MKESYLRQLSPEDLAKALALRSDEELSHFFSALARRLQLIRNPDNAFPSDRRSNLDARIIEKLVDCSNHFKYESKRCGQMSGREVGIGPHEPALFTNW
jgi:hypothetical protein